MFSGRRCLHRYFGLCREGSKLLDNVVVLSVVTIAIEVPVVPTFWVDFSSLHQSGLVDPACRHHLNGSYRHILFQTVTVLIKVKLIEKIPETHFYRGHASHEGVLVSLFRNCCGASPQMTRVVVSIILRFWCLEDRCRLRFQICRRPAPVVGVVSRTCPELLFIHAGRVSSPLRMSLTFRASA